MIAGKKNQYLYKIIFNIFYILIYIKLFKKKKKAESIYENIDKEVEIKDYFKNLKNSWVLDELYMARNSKSAFKGGLF